MNLSRPAGSAGHGGDPVVLTPEDAGWVYTGLRVLELEPEDSRSIDLGDAEAAVIPLAGSAVVETGDGDRFDLAGRAGVFEAVTDLCFVSRQSSISLHSSSGGQFAVATARADHRTEAFYRPASEIEIQVRGAGQATRQITQLLGADVSGPNNLMVVEVLTPAGNWSSYPPHKHDEWSEEEVPLEEIYYFRINGDDGFGLHRTYTSDGEIDETVTVFDGDVFLVPRGYHGPCVAAPGYDMYYLNVMAGPGPGRGWKICTDPAHSWLWEAWRGQASDPRVPLTGLVGG